MTRSLPCSRQPQWAAWSHERLEHARALALGSAIDASSTAAYGSVLNSYLSFCRSHDFPINPTPDTLSFYTVYMAHHIKPSSVDSYLSGICNELEPFHPDVWKNCRHHLVTRTLRGCKKLHAVPTTCKRPLSCTELAELCTQYMSSNSHDDLLFFIILLVGFHALMHLGELVGPDKKDLQQGHSTMNLFWRRSGRAFLKIFKISQLPFPIPSSTLVVSRWVCTHLWVVHSSSMSALPCGRHWSFLACWGSYCTRSSWYAPSHHPSDWLLCLWHFSNLYSSPSGASHRSTF